MHKLKVWKTWKERSVWWYHAPNLVVCIKMVTDLENKLLCIVWEKKKRRQHKSYLANKLQTSIADKSRAIRTIQPDMIASRVSPFRGQHMTMFNSIVYGCLREQHLHLLRRKRHQSHRDTGLVCQLNYFITVMLTGNWGLCDAHHTWGYSKSTQLVAS